MDKITRIFGVPLVCRTDGGPQFRGPFKNYCLQRGIVHETSSPYNPRSNGHAEAAVKAAKYLLLKTKPSEFSSALAAWRNTAREDKPSPNELMFCRKIRDGKAVLESQLYLQNVEQVDQKIHESDSGTLNLSHFNASPVHPDIPTRSAVGEKAPHHQTPEYFRQGDKVHVQNPCTKRWNISALVTGFSKTGRTLELMTDEGDFILRNRRFVRRRCAV